MTKTITTYGKIDTQSMEFIGFGLFDKKGREIGARVTLQMREMVLVETNEEYRCGFSIEPGNYFTFTPSAARGGQSFGAFSGTRYFKSEAARSAAVAKYLAAAKKRAAKTAA
jgi:hypothetical protein